MLCAEERAAALAATARLQNRLAAYLTGLAGAADVAGDSRVLGAGTTGSLVAIATNSPVAVGSGIVHTAKQLQDLPVVKDAWAEGAISGLHVHQILAHAPGDRRLHQPNKPPPSAWRNSRMLRRSAGCCRSPRMPTTRPIWI